MWDVRCGTADKASSKNETQLINIIDCLYKEAAVTIAPNPTVKITIKRKK